MKFIIVISILAVIITFLDSRGKFSNGLGVSFIILGTVAALHCNFGPDYNTYESIFNLITGTPFSLEKVFNKTLYKDPGWTLLNYAFKPFGFYAMVAAIAIFQNTVYYRLIKEYVPRELWAFSMFIYVFNFNIYVLNMSMLRQGLAIAIFASAFPLIENKKIIPALIVAFLAYTIHSSAFICLPFALLGLYEGKSNKTWVAILIIIFFVLMIAGGAVGNIYSEMIAMDEFEQYEEYSEFNNDTRSSFGLGFFAGLLPFFLGLLYLLKEDAPVRVKRLCILFCFGALFVPFGLEIHLIDRLAFYFDIFGLVVIPIIYHNIRNGLYRWGLVALYIGLLLLAYYVTTTSKSFLNSFETYHTFFEYL